MSKKTKTRNKAQVKKVQLQKLGRTHLEVKKPKLLTQVKPQLAQLEKRTCDPAVRLQVDTLFFRCGAYEEFLQRKTSKQHNMFVKARSYVHDMTAKVTQWFGGLRRSKSPEGTPGSSQPAGTEQPVSA